MAACANNIGKTTDKTTILQWCSKAVGQTSEIRYLPRICRGVEMISGLEDKFKNEKKKQHIYKRYVDLAALISSTNTGKYLKTFFYEGGWYLNVYSHNLTRGM